MELIDKKIIEKNVNNHSSYFKGIEYMNNSLVSLTYQQSKSNIIEIEGKCNNLYNCFLKINNEKIEDMECSCSIFLSNNKYLCSHLVSLCFQYNYSNLINNHDLFLKTNDYSILFLIDFFSNKIIITPRLEIFNKQHEILNLNTFKDDGFLELSISIGKKIKINLNKIIESKIYFLFDLLKGINSFFDKFNNKSFLLKNNKLNDFIEYCKFNEIKLFYEKDSTKIILFDEISNLDEQKKTKIIDSFYRKKITIKKNFNDLFFLKTDFIISDYFFENNTSIFLLSNLISGLSIFCVVKNDDYLISKNFYWFFNHGVSKNDFYMIYNYIKNNFSTFEWYFDELFIEKNNLLKKDPILSLEIVFNDQINNPALIVKYEYLDNFYFHNLDDDKDFDKRKKEIEEKLFNRISKFCGTYDYQYNCFIFYYETEFMKMIKWMTSNKNNESYIIKIARNLLFKQKVKTKFMISGLNGSHDIMKVNWKLENYSEEESKLIVEAYMKKQEFVTLSNSKMMNVLKEIDFDDFENQLKLFNSNIRDYLANNVICKKWNYFLLKDKFSNNDKISDFVNKFKEINSIKLNINNDLKKTLKSYQIYGCKWLKLHYQLQTGSILADEMGLGKTIQSITFLDDFYSDNKKHISLIVAPSSLIYNWKKEFNKFSPRLKVGIIDGSFEKRNELIQQIHLYDVIVVSYNLLKIDFEYFSKIDFDIVLIDEGHTIKNHFTKFAKCIKSLNAKHKIALTGTPMENNALELWSLFDFIMPGFLNEFGSFKKMISNSSKDQYEFLRKKISPFILRRTKKDVLKELPDKIEKIIPIDFNEEQKILYSSLLENVREDISESMKTKDIEKNKIYILSLLTKLRQLCCSPLLIYENAKSHGSKFDTCIKLIEDILQRNEKVLLFSQFTNMLDIFAKTLHKMNIKYYVITGETKKSERQVLVDNFNKNDDVNVFLISLKAGGVGLNLTSASNVIHYDLWWNLSVENQASDRTHRIGQKNNVTIYKLVMNDSIEEKIIDIQNLKKNLINTILDFKDKSYENISMKEMLTILNIKNFSDK